MREGLGAILAGLESVRGLLLQACDALFVLDGELRFQRLWGSWHLPDPVGRTAVELFGPVEGRVHQEANLRALAGESLSYLWEYRGQEYKTYLEPVREGEEIKGLLGSVRTMGCRRLEQKMRTFERILNRSTTVAFSWRPEPGWPTDFVSENVRQFGYEVEAFTSGRILFEEIIHPEDLERVRQEVEVYLAELRSYYEQEYRILTGTGEVCWVMDWTWVKFDQDGKPLALEGLLQDVTGRKEAEVALLKSERLMRNILDSLDGQIAIVDKNGKILYTNRGWEAFGRENGLMGDLSSVGQNYLEIAEADEQGKLAAQGIRRVLSGDSSGFSMEYPCFSSKAERWFLMRVTPFQGEGPRAVISHLDITQQKASERELQRLSSEQDMLLNHIDTQIWYLKDEKTYGAVNEARAQFLGWPKEQLEGRSIHEIMNPERAEVCVERNHLVFQQRRETYEESWWEDGQGNRCLLALTKIPKIGADGQVEYVICAAQDITEQKQSKEELRYLSYRDKLTGLYNRTFFDEEMKRLDAQNRVPLSILMGDVNGLKLVNDAFGHQAGDELLVRVAQILKASCRQDDIVSRWAGDEFIVLLPGATKRMAEKVANRIKKACQSSNQETIPLRIGIGVATKEDPSETLADVLKQAEDRMYRNKLLERQTTHSNIVNSLVHTLGEKSLETEEHVQRLREMVLPLGEKMDLTDGELDELALLASLHDIGKVAVSEAILTKPTRLTEQEWAVIQKHPEIGYRIASSSPTLAPIAQAILAHHERWDGRGYPQGLKGEEIPITARILAVVDAFDAMTHTRPYRQSMSEDKALRELERCSGTQFDPEVVRLFVQWMREGAVIPS